MSKDTSKQKLYFASSASQESERWIVRHCRNAHPHICDYFITKHGYSDLCRLTFDSGSKSKLAHIKDLVGDFIYLLRKIKRIRAAREIIAIGPMAVNVTLLLKLGLLPSCRRVYWFGIFIHSPRWLLFARYAFRILDSRKIQYVVFSDFEKTLYAKSLLMHENRMFYVPYGDLSEQKISSDAEISVLKDINEGEFYFSGGYSNRDYPSLIDTFRTLPYKLIIVCSVLNTEIDEAAIPPNVKVLRELPPEAFDAYIIASKACIIPIAHNTGAAGQSCLLRYMKSRKIIIATDTGIIREYITDNVSGILVRDNRESMAVAIRAVDANTGRYQGYADNAHERYFSYFSGDALARRLDQMVNENDGD